jgi:hypothetical protein
MEINSKSSEQFERFKRPIQPKSLKRDNPSEPVNISEIHQAP